MFSTLKISLLGCSVRCTIIAVHFCPKFARAKTPLTLLHTILMQNRRKHRFVLRLRCSRLQQSQAISHRSKPCPEQMMWMFALFSSLSFSPFLSLIAPLPFSFLFSLSSSPSYPSRPFILTIDPPMRGAHVLHCATASHGIHISVTWEMWLRLFEIQTNISSDCQQTLKLTFSPIPNRWQIWYMYDPASNIVHWTCPVVNSTTQCQPIYVTWMKWVVSAQNLSVSIFEILQNDSRKWKSIHAMLRSITFPSVYTLRSTLSRSC